MFMFIFMLGCKFLLSSIKFSCVNSEVLGSRLAGLLSVQLIYVNKTVANAL